jgi:hypothetical protein
VDHWILQISEKIKVECLSTLISLGGIVTVGFGSVRAIDLVLEFLCFIIWSVEDIVTQNREL